MESKFEVGVPSGKLSWPPKNCIPRRAKMKMKRKRRRRRDIIEDKAFIRAITRFLNGDQYLHRRVQCSAVQCTNKLSLLYRLFQLHLLCNFKNSKQTQCPEARETKRSCAGFEVYPEHFKDGSEDDDTIKLVESRVEVVWTERIHAYNHFKYKGT